MTATLPQDVQQVFDRFITTEYTTVDGRASRSPGPSRPTTVPATSQIDITTGLGYPKKAEDARRNPKVSLLFSDPTGSGMERPPAVLVQGTATGRRRRPGGQPRALRAREHGEASGHARSMMPPKFMQRFLQWYYTRLYVHVRPERIYVWPEGDFTREPQLFGSHIEEVRSRHVEEPEVPLAAADGRPDALGRPATRARPALRHGRGLVVAPDGFAMSARVLIEPDEAAGRIRLKEVPVGVPLAPGPPASPLMSTTPTSSGRSTSRCGATSSARTAAGQSSRASSLAASSFRPPRRSPATASTPAKCPRFRKIAKRQLAARGR